MPDNESSGPAPSEDVVGEIAAEHGDNQLLRGLTPGAAVGQVLLLDYNTATLAVHDYHKERAGGLSRGMFLIAGRIPEEDDAAMVLMRVVGAKRLANHTTTQEARLTAARDSIGRELWTESLTRWIADEIALGGIEARVLGTLTIGATGELGFAEDISNYYSAHGAYAWKPEGELLERIVNLSHRSNNLDFSELGSSLDSDRRIGIAVTRFSSALDSASEGSAQVPLRIDPTDLLKRRTVFLGMSRSGKSNAMKITAQAVYLLRGKHEKLRVGQLVFDPNGEYAQDNPQDGRGLHRIHDLLGRERSREVETYGMYVPESDSARRITKVNFFGNAIPRSDPPDHEATETALEQLLVGKTIIGEELGSEDAQYVRNYRDADLSVPPNYADRGAAVRYHRSVLVHRVALAAAGFGTPRSTADLRGLFSRGFCAALRSAGGRFEQAADTLARDSASWSSLANAFQSLDVFVRGHAEYETFERQYRQRPNGSGEDWADARLKSVLSIFRTPNGVRKLQRMRNQHSVRASSDFAEDIVQDLKAGKLVIFDQSVGSPELNRRAAERIMWKVFRAQQAMFTSDANAEPWEGHVLVYVEEAHNLLPRTGGKDVLSTVWARAAKEGGKMNVGMVLATQAPSSVLPEILSETDNWFISHLNSDGEARVVEGYQDFADFVPQIRRVSEPGFIRLRTLSAGYTVPVQLDRFRLPDPPDTTEAE
ncbi:helicase HerA domain-containing protein [Candidatus Palauibacter sp.]|uniref:helicase HerA domain-containing protein n=1 Tax=Candidatus Palauibacter sp. TaxID=3101350 RepID=UPI003AF2F51B